MAGPAARKYKAQGFEVLGIVTDDAPRSKVAAMTEKYGIRCPILRCNHATAHAYGGLPDPPESFFANRHGKIVAEMTGADSEQDRDKHPESAGLSIEGDALSMRTLGSVAY